ncbi:hypothetical protein BE11_32410 [Sorangium cellulosum]|nr:hypothetical protein BE11_32410 [Sorangium cellulosum]
MLLMISHRTRNLWFTPLCIVTALAGLSERPAIAGEAAPVEAFNEVEMSLYETEMSFALSSPDEVSLYLRVTTPNGAVIDYNHPQGDYARFASQACEIEGPQFDLVAGRPRSAAARAATPSRSSTTRAKSA